MKRIIAIFIGILFLSIISMGFFIQRYYQNKHIEIVLKNNEDIKQIANKALKLSEEAHSKAIKEYTKKMAEDAAKLAQRSKKMEWDALSVKCPKCTHQFEAHKNKAPLLKAVLSGAGTGAAVGGTGGLYIGSGTGIAMGGIGAFPGTIVGGIIGAVGGGVTGGMGAAWYRDRQVMCPFCGNLFTNPKN